jgi:osmotically-inducible protein OsmY
MQARNVKVISQNGVVTLRGPVETEAEKANIETLARNAGATQIDNQLEVAGRVESAPATPTTPAPAEGTREEY